MEALQIIFGGLVSLGGLSGVVALLLWRHQVRKLRAETHHTEIDAAIAEDRADDEHWREIVKTQTEALVQPLREELTRLRVEVDSLRSEVEATRTRYWRAIAYIRVLLTITQRRNPNDDVPAPPSEIAADL